MADEVETQTVEALEPLMHRGKVVEAGDEVEVFVHDAERLIANGAAKVKGRANRLLKRSDGTGDSSDTSK